MNGSVRVPLGVPNCSPVFAFGSCDGRAKFPTGLETICWSTSQLPLVCKRATASNLNSSRLLLEKDNLRPKLLTSKNQTIVNLGEEYLPSKFFSCLRLVRTFIIYLSIKNGYSGQKCLIEVDCFRQNCLLQDNKYTYLTLDKLKDCRNFVSA